MTCHKGNYKKQQTPHNKQPREKPKPSKSSKRVAALPSSLFQPWCWELVVQLQPLPIVRLLLQHLLKQQQRQESAETEKHCFH